MYEIEFDKSSRKLHVLQDRIHIARRVISEFEDCKPIWPEVLRW